MVLRPGFMASISRSKAAVPVLVFSLVGRRRGERESIFLKKFNQLFEVRFTSNISAYFSHPVPWFLTNVYSHVNSHYNQDIEHLHPLLSIPYPYPNPSPKKHQPIICNYSYAFSRISYKWRHTMQILFILLLWLNTMLLRFSHIVACVLYYLSLFIAEK